MENPPIRILQRPCQSSDNQTSQIIKPPATVKTLEQREADYAAARRRILGSDGSEPDVDDSSTVKVNAKTLGSGNDHSGNTVSRQSLSTIVNTTATPLMSIQAIPATVNALTADFGTAVTSALTSNGVVQSRMTHNGGARQGFAVVNVAQKLQQQQPQPLPNVTRPVLPTQQPQRLLMASASSPSFFTNPRTTNQPVPLFPSHVNAANTGLLPTPPGFNYSMQNATLNGGNGMHHSHSAAYALMHQFGLFQQHYQQALNGFQNHLISPAMSQTGASLSPFNFSVASQPTANQKYTHPSTFN